MIKKTEISCNCNTLHQKEGLAYTEIIIERYSGMTNEQLLLLYENEIANLTPEARGLLITELKNRECYPPHASAEYVNTSIATITLDKLPQELFFFINDSLEKGCEYGYLTGGLLERGLTEEEINNILNNLLPFFNTLLQKNAEKLLTSVFMATAGIALLSLPLNRDSQLFVIIIAYLSIFWGCLNIFHRIFKKKKLKNVLKNLESLNKNII